MVCYMGSRNKFVSIVLILFLILGFLQTFSIPNSILSYAPPSRDHVAFDNNLPSQLSIYYENLGQAGDLNVKYYVGQSGASEDISFGINDNGCFTNTPSDISGSHDGCDDSKIKYTFKPK